MQELIKPQSTKLVKKSFIYSAHYFFLALTEPFKNVQCRKSRMRKDNLYILALSDGSKRLNYWHDSGKYC